MHMEEVEGVRWGWMAFFIAKLPGGTFSLCPGEVLDVVFPTLPSLQTTPCYGVAGPPPPTNVGPFFKPNQCFVRATTTTGPQDLSATA